MRQVDSCCAAYEPKPPTGAAPLPMLQPCRIDTGFDLAPANRASGADHWAQTPLQAATSPCGVLAEQGLALVDRPYDRVAEQLGARRG